jgi:hypothetical protein
MRRSDANKNTSHDLNETLFAPRERTQIDPDVLSGKPLPWAEPGAGQIGRLSRDHPRPQARIEALGQSLLLCTRWRWGFRWPTQLIHHASSFTPCSLDGHESQQ